MVPTFETANISRFYQISATCKVKVGKKLLSASFSARELVILPAQLSPSIRSRPPTLDPVTAELGAPLNPVAAELGAPLDTVAAELGAPLDPVAAELGAPLDPVIVELEAPIQPSETKTRREGESAATELAQPGWLNELLHS